MRLISILIMLILITACSTATSPSTESPQGDVSPIPVLTQRLNTPDTDELIATQRPLIPIQTPVECDGTPPTRLIIQQRGRVTDDNNDTLNLRSGPGTSFDILARLDPLDIFVVIGGPTCAEGFTWFRIRFGTRIGWIAEGDSEIYYVEPYLSG